MPEALYQIRGLVKTYGCRTILGGLDLDVYRGDKNVHIQLHRDRLRDVHLLGERHGRRLPARSFPPQSVPATAR